MEKTYFTNEPERILYLKQNEGPAEVWLRQNIEEIETEEGIQWTAEEVMIHTNLTQEEIESQFDSYFFEEPETTVDDLVEAIDLLTTIVLEG